MRKRIVRAAVFVLVAMGLAVGAAGVAGAAGAGHWTTVSTSGAVWD
jgi:hypothetical protein